MTQPNQYEDKEAGVEIAIRKPDYCPHGADLNIAVCHRCDGTAIYTEQDLAQKQLEARIKELEMMQGGDVEFQRYSEWRIAELKAQAKE